MKNQVNNQYMKAIKQWKVTFHRRDELDVVKYFTCNKFEVLKSVKLLNDKYREEGFVGVYSTVEEVPYTPKPLTSLFLEKDKREALCSLLKSVKAQYKAYKEIAKDSPTTNRLGAKGLITSQEKFKQCQLRRFAEDMWNSLQNEFYMTADITWNSIWRYQDEFKEFDKSGYLLGVIPEKLLPWTEKLKNNYHRDWTIEVLKLIKDFNLDNQPEDYSTAFMNDFMAVKNHQQFCSVLLKWTDLIRWSPEKLSLYDNTFQQPMSVHYEDDYNPEVDSDSILD